MNKAITKTLCHLLLISTIGLLPLSAWSADKTPGGKGKLESLWWLDCFKPASGIVTEVCAKYTINWKLWSLMGEPVGDYNVSWTLTSLKLMDPQRNLISSFTLDNLPNELRKATGRIELYIDGIAAVQTQGSNSGDGFHHFNTGVAVRAGAGSSFNMPGSTSWNTLFVTARFNACDDKFSTYMDAKLAKEKFLQGIQLSSLEVCPSSGVSELTSLESAIYKMCEKPGADKKYQFCPIQKPKEKKESGNDAIDDAFSTMEKQSGKIVATKTGNIDDEFEKMEAYRVEQERLRIAALKAKQEREARHNEAVVFCEKMVSDQQSCFENSCGTMPEKTITQCNYSKLISPNASGLMNASWTSNQSNQYQRLKVVGESHIIFPNPNSGCTSHEVPNQKYTEWESCSRDAETKCSQHGKRISSIDACVSQHEQEANRKAPASSYDAPVIEQLKGKLKDALKCDPKAGEKCSPRKKNSNPGGVRG